ncbi:MAG: response regulator [Pseudomonadota bacterium]
MQIGVDTSRAVDNKRVFVIDDDEIMRAALQFMLHDENETHELRDVDEALRKGLQYKPDVVLLGIEVVRRLGVGVLLTLKKNIDGLKVLLVAESREDPLVAGCLQCGADAVLLKPITVEQTRKQVNRLLGRASRTVIAIHAL